MEESQVDELDSVGEYDVSSSVYDALILSYADVSSVESVSLHATGFQGKVHRAQICQFLIPRHQDHNAQGESLLG